MGAPESERARAIGSVADSRNRCLTDRSRAQQPGAQCPATHLHIYSARKRTCAAEQRATSERAEVRTACTISPAERMRPAGGCRAALTALAYTRNQAGTGANVARANGQTIEGDPHAGASGDLQRWPPASPGRISSGANCRLRRRSIPIGTHAIPRRMVGQALHHAPRSCTPAPSGKAWRTMRRRSRASWSSPRGTSRRNQ